MNLKTNEVLVVKMFGSDQRARAIITHEALMQLNWLDADADSLFDRSIYSVQGFKTGEIVPCFKLNVPVCA
jgi:hypothetical protein